MEYKYDKKTLVVLGHILRKLNLGQKTVTPEEIVRSSDPDSQKSMFSFDKLDAQGVLKELEKHNLVVETEKGVFGITVDISTLREFILLAEGYTANEEEQPAPPVALQDILEKEWSLKDAEENEGGEDDGSMRSYIEERRKELLRRLGQNTSDNDDDGVIDLDEIFDDDEEEQTAPSLCDEVSRRLREGMKVVTLADRIFIQPQEQTAKGVTVRLELTSCEGTVYISDRGAALITLGKRISLDTEGVDEAIGNIVDRYGVTVCGEELRVEVPSPDEAMDCVFRLYAAMELIMNMDEEALAACVERRKTDKISWEVLTQLVEEDNEIDRVQAILRLRTLLGEGVPADADELLRYAAALRSLVEINDEEFDVYRMQILGLGEQSDEGTPDESEDVASAEEPQENCGGVSPSSEEIARDAKTIEETLAGFGIDARVYGAKVGAAFTRYDIELPEHVPVPAVIKYDIEISLRLQRREGVRMYHDVENGRICVEVPRAAEEREAVHVGELVHDGDERWLRDDALMFAIGKDVDGFSVYGDMAQLAHILVGGTSGSGKSSFLHTMIYSFITKYSPSDVRLILCAPEGTGFACYEGMPHLLTGQIITEFAHVLRALKWAVKETERRYQLFSERTAEGTAVRNINEYNAARKEDEAKLPRIVIVIDEYSEYLASGRPEPEAYIQRLAQKARAAGIHIVLATQSASSNVITGAIRGLLPTQIAFRVMREADSRTILNERGAETLLGKGDMLMKTSSSVQCKRVQGVYMCREIALVAVAAVKKTYQAQFDEQALRYIGRTGKTPAVRVADAYPDDPCCIKALAIVVKLGEVSISLIQRKCSVGYNHSGKIVEWMERMGYVSPFDGESKTRKVLLTKEDFEALYGPLE